MGPTSDPFSTTRRRTQVGAINLLKAAGGGEFLMVPPNYHVAGIDSRSQAHPTLAKERSIKVIGAETVLTLTANLL